MKLKPAVVRKNLGASATDAQRLFILELFCGEPIHKSINDRAALLQRIAEHQKGGKVWVQTWGRDCDGVEGFDTFKIDATLQAFYQTYQREAESAEGPFSVEVIPHRGETGSWGQGWGIN
jgi:hypothetical protein